MMKILWFISALWVMFFGFLEHEDLSHFYIIAGALFMIVGQLEGMDR